MNILLLLHTYAPNQEFGSFTKEIIQGFRNSGANIHVIKTNDLVDGLGSRSWSSKLDIKKLNQIFKNTKFDMIFTTNHGGVNETIRKLSGNTPIISWMVDRNPFKHNGYLRSKIFDQKDHVITSSTANVPSLCEKFNLNEKNVHYLPFMTNPASFQDGKEKDINISFVGSYFLNESIVKKAINLATGTKHYKPLLEAIQILENDFDTNENILFREKGLSMFLVAMRMTPRHLKGAIGNMISNHKRLLYLSSITDKGLELYGTRNLADLINFSPQISACYNANYFVNTRERLVDIYDRSKIGLNINHHQATTGLGYRVFDIMYSSAMLVSNYQKQADLDVLFGKNHPVPIYKTPDELSEICSYYLEHENERLEITKKCRELIIDTHTFDKRIPEIIQIIDPSFKAVATSGEYHEYTPLDLWSVQGLTSLETATTHANLPRIFIQNYLKKFDKILNRIGK